MAGKRRRKAAPAAAAASASTESSTNEETGTSAATKTSGGKPKVGDQDAAEVATLEHVMVDFWTGLVPWTENSPDRTLAVTALLDGKATVLSLDNGTTTTTTNTTATTMHSSSTSSSSAAAATAFAAHATGATSVSASSAAAAIAAAVSSVLEVDASTGALVVSSAAPVAAGAGASATMATRGGGTGASAGAAASGNEPNQQQQQPPLPASELYGFYMALGSHILSRLLTEHSAELLARNEALEEQEDSSDTVSLAYRRVLCFLCYALSTALFRSTQPAQDAAAAALTSGKTDDATKAAASNTTPASTNSTTPSDVKWDKASTGPARHWLARLVKTLAAACGQHALFPTASAATSSPATKGSRAKDKAAAAAAAAAPSGALNRSALAAATLCLERLVIASGGPIVSAASLSSSSSSAYMGTPAHIAKHWRTAIRPLLHQWAEQGMMATATSGGTTTNAATMATSCRGAFGAVGGDWSRERACLAALQSATPVLATLQATFGELRQHHPPLRVEGRLAYRRWSAVVLDWYSQAPVTMLQQALTLLQQEQQQVQLQEQSAEMESISSGVALAMIGQWTNWMVDWTSKSGARAPTGNLDHYLKQISLGRAKKKSKTPDARELALSVCLHSVELHGTCLSQLQPDERTLGEIGMINDKDWVNEPSAGVAASSAAAVERNEDSKKKVSAKQPTKSGSKDLQQEQATSFYPFMAQLLCNLARVSTNTSGSGSSTTIPTFLDQVENAAAAFVLRQQIVRDVHLLHWALQQARVLLVQFDSGSMSTTYDHLLVEPLVSVTTTKSGTTTRLQVLPAAPSSGRKRKSSTESTATPSQRLTVYERFALFLRAMHDPATATTAATSSKKNPSPAVAKELGRAFVCHLLRVVEGCLDTRTASSVAAAAAAVAAVASVAEPPPPAAEPTGSRSKKRKPAAATATRRSKRRKQDVSATPAAGPAAAPKPEAEHKTPSQPAFPPATAGGFALGDHQPITNGRAALASMALDIIQGILDATRPVGQRFPCLGSGVLGSSELCRIVRLGEVLDTVLLRTRSWDKLPDESSEGGPSLHNPSLNSGEKKLWSSQMDVSITMGKGASFLDSETPLSGNRLEIFQEIARCSKALCVNRDDAAWPLWLPTAHWLLVSSNMANEKERAETEAERFIVDGVLKSIEYILSDLSVLLPLIPTTSKVILADPEIPLSLQDAQLYLGALVRLPKDQQRSVLLSLTKSVHASLEKIQQNVKSMQIVKRNRVVSGFLARLVTTCTHAAVFSHSEEEVRRQILQTLNCVAIGSPSFWLASEGYQLQGHFMGLLSDRESSLLPNTTMLPASLNNEAATSLKMLLKVAFQMGLDTSPDDSGYLMFSAWNALGKAPVWSPEIPSPLVSDFPTDSPASQLLVLRENVCLVYQQIRAYDGVINPSSTTIMRAFSSKLGSSPDSQTIAMNIRALIEKGATMVEAILEDTSSEDMDLSAEAFALLEAICLSLSFAVSCITKPSANYVADLVHQLEAKRPRGYSSESEVAGSDNESGATEADARVDALERIEQSVSRIGGAPAHPDWLDTTCTLRFGISMAEAQLLASRAMGVITSTVRIAKTEQHKTCRTSLMAQGGPEDFPVLSDLALKLITGSVCTESISGDTDPADDIARICNVSSKVVKYIMDNTAGLSSLSAMATWCANSAQRILGQFHTLFRNQMIDLADAGLGELRCGDEWEIALSFALTSTCAGFPGEDADSGLKTETLDSLVGCNRWERLASTAQSCLVPASALVHFTVIGKGRKQHPFSKLDSSVDDYQFGKVYLPKPLPMDGVAADVSLKTVLHSAANLLASSPLHSDPTSEFVAANIFVDPTVFLRIQSAASVGAALDTLSSIVEASDSLVERQEPGVIPAIVGRLVDVLVTGDNFDPDNNTSGIVKFFLQQGKEPSHLWGGGSFTSCCGSVSPLSFGEGLRKPVDLAPPLLHLLWKDSPRCDKKSRQQIIVELGNLAMVEMRKMGKSDFTTRWIEALPQVPPDCMQKLFEEELFLVGETPVAASLSALFVSALLGVAGGMEKGFERVVFDLLLKLASDSGKVNVLPKHSLDLLFLYGTYCKDLGSISSWLLGDVEGNIASIDKFVSFLGHLWHCLHSASSSPKSSTVEQSSATVQRTCSYVLKEGFYEQHWYNCKTCGLVDERGCCTLCALVCHQGHDVSYSRCSSFFCDCGAQGSSGPELESQAATQCKCLTPVPADRVSDATRMGENPRELGGPRKPLEADASSMETFEVVNVAVRAFRDVATESLRAVTQAIKKAGAVREIESLVRHEIGVWKKRGPPFPAKQLMTLENFRNRMLASGGCSDSTVCWGEPPLSFVCSSTDGLFSTLSSPVDQSLERSRARLLDRGNHCSVIDADSRGRLIVCEAGKLTFFSGGALPGGKALGDSPFGRQLLPVAGSERLPMKTIFGFSLNRENENLLLVWGPEEVMVLVLNEAATGVQSQFNLECSGTSEGAVKFCCWLPNSGHRLLVGHNSCIRTYTLCRGSPKHQKNEICKILPDLSLSVNASLTIRDMGVVAATDSPAIKSWRLYLLLSDGSLHSTHAREDESGFLSCPLQTVGSSESIVFLEPGGTASSETHAHDARIDILHQSRLLLYQSGSTRTTAFVLDRSGSIVRRFQLIPANLTVDDKHISGPFSHFTELGLSQHNGAERFRVACVSSSKSESSVVLSFEFNDDCEVRLGKVVSLGRESLVEGTCAFCIPFVEKDDDEMNLLEPKDFLEKTHFCVLESSGRLSICCDGQPGVSSEQLASFSERVMKSTFPLLIFERLTSLSTSDLVYHVDGCSSSDLATKLQRDSDSFFLSPRRDGFTLTVSPQPSKNGIRPIVAALRVLVGRTSTSCVPQKMYVGGRPVQLQQGTKRWYSVILTASEIALAARNGYVTITFTMDGTNNNPILDALDVFSIKRGTVEGWMPQRLRHLCSSDSSKETQSFKQHGSTLFCAVNALSHLPQVLQPFSASKEERQILSDLVARTCFDCKTSPRVEELVKSIEPEGSQQLLDKARLVGCMEFLKKCPSGNSELTQAGSTSTQSFWRENGWILERCLETASEIARNRPMNYTTNASIASLASAPVAQCLFLTLDLKNLVHKYVEVCLLEMAGSMGNFAPLRALLSQRSDAVVKPSCEAISRFCTKYSSRRLLNGDYDFFNSGREMAYGCDNCGVMPIQGIRYTLSDDDHPFDLCSACHELAMKHASENKLSETVEVMIDGHPVGDDPRLTCAEVGRMQPVQDHRSADTEDRQQLYSVFLDGLFNGLVALVPGVEGEEKFAPIHLIQLVVGLVDLADKKRRVERKKRIVKELCHGMSVTLKAAAADNQNNGADAMHRILECYIGSLSALVVSDSSARQLLTGQKSSCLADKTGDEKEEGKKKGAVSCGMHEGQALYRQASEGGDRFFVCSKDRCNFFMWAKEDSQKTSTENEFDIEAAHHVWKMLTVKTPSDHGTSLHSRISEYIGHFSGRQVDAKPVVATTRTFADANRDIQDGVLCCRERLLGRSAEDMVAKAVLLPLARSVCPDSGWNALMESCLELLCLAVGTETDEGVGPWFPVLCNILMEEKPSMRSLAKTAVFRLCGRNSELYYAVRDHHAFAMHMRRVIVAAQPALAQANILKERARQCSPDWKHSMPFAWKEGGGFELVNVQMLIGEDTLSRSSHDSIRKLLQDLLSSAKKRRTNWKRFCRHTSIPLVTKSDGDPQSSLLLCVPPLRAILYLSCVLPPDCQTKLMKLLDLGIGNSSDSKPPCSTSSAPSVAVMDFVEPKGLLLESGADAFSLSEDNLCCFALNFVGQAGTADLRRAAASVTAKLCCHVKSSIAERVAQRLVYTGLAGVGERGRAGVEFVALLASIIGGADCSGGTIKEMAEFVRQIWSEQFLGLRHDRANQEYLFFESRVGQTTNKKRFDLAPCFHCHCQNQNLVTKGKSAGRESDVGAGNAHLSRPAFASSHSSVAMKKPWLDSQVAPFARGRLETIRDSHTSTEFATFVSLKYRLAISDIFVEVHEPRGRYVKTIKVYASTRVVEDVSCLKTGHKWQEVSTLTLAQGGTRASCSLDKPILAANLKLIYSEFYDRPHGGSRAADGTLLVHCPRCARVVTNAHGVCSACGEVAFQCRKCRHINYDRLDAFLCVECGYCASGTFVYEVNAGIASNATSISNEQDYNRAKGQLELSTKLYDDILRCFKDHYSLATRGSKQITGAVSDFPTDSLQAAFAMEPEETHAADLAPDNIGKQGSVVKALARPGASSLLTEGVDCYQSVLSLSRSSSSSTTTRRRSRDIIIRHVGRDLSVDEDESDLIGLLESTDSMARASSGLDPSDPLSRLLASVQSRREQRENQESRTRRRDNTATNATGASSSVKTRDTKELMEVCDKLHVLLQEAERETFQLRRRISAWQSLDRGDLSGDTSGVSNRSFIPSHCWACAGSLAGHLLLLWIRLFQAAPDSVPVSISVVRLLLQEDQGATKNLMEWKRLALREIALKSRIGSGLILDTLKLRLSASQDINAAEILGQIVGATCDDPQNLKGQFINLAKEQLRASYL